MASSFFTKVVGVSFGNSQNIISRLHHNMQLKLVREPDNSYDSNAIAVFFANHHLGYLPRFRAQEIAPLIDSGEYYIAYVANVTGGTDGKYFGLNIKVYST